MAKFTDAFQTLTAYLAANVANGATVDVAYPAGTAQRDFDAGLSGPGSYVMVNDNDKWTAAAGKVSFSFGSSLITVTNNSGVTWTAGSKLVLSFDQVDGNHVALVQVPYNLAALANGAMLNPGLRLGLTGTVEYYEALVKTAATTAAKLATLQPTIDGVAVTGGALALTSANATPAGIILPAPLITGGNVIKPANRLGFLVSGVTAFAEGEIVLNVRIRTVMSNNY